MANILYISDLAAPELAPFARLTEAQLRSRRDPAAGVFIAESPKVIALALDAGLTPTAFLMEERHLTGQGAPLIARCGDVPVYTASREVLTGLTGYPLTRGILCAFRRPAPDTPEAVCTGARRVAVLEGIVDTTNVGAIFRSAAGLHMDAVLLSPTCCDPPQPPGGAGEHGHRLSNPLGPGGPAPGPVAHPGARAAGPPGLCHSGYGPQ